MAGSGRAVEGCMEGRWRNHEWITAVRDGHRRGTGRQDARVRGGGGVVHGQRRAKLGLLPLESAPDPCPQEKRSVKRVCAMSGWFTGIQVIHRQ